MTWHNAPYAVPLLLAALLAAGVACHAWSHRGVPGAAALLALMLAAAEWALAGAAELASADLPSKLLAAKASYLGVALVPPLWLAFALHYTGRERWVTRPLLAALAPIPLITVALVWTNEAHGLVWSSTRLATHGPFLILALTHGPWFWAHAAYSYSLLAIGTALVIGSLIRSHRVFQWQGAALLVAVLAPWAANALFLAGVQLMPWVDQTPVAFTVSGVAIAWALTRNRLLDLSPVARAAIFESMSDGVVVLDAQARVVDLNPAAARVLGRPAADLVGQPAARVFVGQAPLLERLQTLDGRDEIILSDALTDHRYELRISPLRRPRGAPAGRLVALHDVTDRKRAEERLKRSELQLAEAQRIARLGSWEWDIRQGTLAWSQELYRIYGLDPAERRASFEAFLERVHPEDRALVRERISTAYRERGAFEFEHRLVRQDGTLRVLDGRGRVVVDEAGRPVRMVGTAQDITEREEAEERAHQLIREQVARAEAESAVRRRDEFLSVAAHELKTPITSLSGFAQLVVRQLDRGGSPDPERLRRVFEAIDQQSRKLSALVRHLLDVSRIETGRLALDRHVVDLTALAQGVVAAAQLRTTRHALDLRAPAGVMALVDPLRLEQVLSNLLDNAIKYSPEGGPVLVEVARAEPGLVRLAVTDRGLGIPPEKRDQIFDRFYQAHASDAGTRVDGLGLGLYISRQILELHGGWIRAECREGGGTRFLVVLPTGVGEEAGSDLAGRGAVSLGRAGE